MKHILYLKHFTRIYDEYVMQCEIVIESSSAKYICTLYNDIQYTNKQRMFAYVKVTV